MTENTASEGSPTPPEETAAAAAGTNEADLARRVKDASSSVAECQAVRLDDGERYVALVRLVEGAAEANTVCNALVARFAKDGIDLVPLVYSDAQWRMMAPLVSVENWADHAAGDAAALPLVELHQKQPDALKRQRKFLMRVARHHAATLELLDGNLDLPAHLVMGVVTRIVHQQLNWLFEIHRQQYEPTPAALSTFEQKIAGSAREFSADDLLLHTECRALETQTRVTEEIALQPWRDVERVHGLIRRALDFARRFERHCAVMLSTPEQRRRRKLITAVVMGSLATVVLIGAIVGYIMTRPLEPITDETVITKAGGITAVYFSGRNFEQQVSTGVDRNVSLYARSAPGRGVPADGFSVRWSGYMYFPKGGKTHICSLNDDGVRLYLGGKQIINEWKAGKQRRTCKRIRLSRKGWYALKVEYFDDTSVASLRLMRGDNLQRLQGIPSGHLCCGDPRKNPLPQLGAHEQLFGGQTGNTMRYRCPLGTQVERITTTASMTGGHLGSVRPACRRLKAATDGVRFDGRTSWGPKWGKEQRGAPIALTCGNGQVLVGIYGRYQRFVNGIGGLCAPVNRLQTIAGTRRSTSSVGRLIGTPFRLRCPAGQVLSGMQGRAGALIDAIGIQCRRAPLLIVPPKPTLLPKPKPTPVKPGTPPKPTPPTKSTTPATPKQPGTTKPPKSN